MRALVWISEGSWRGCVDAAGRLLAPHAEVTLVHIVAGDAERLAAGPPVPERLGRHRPPPPGPPVHELSDAEARELLEAARAQLGRPARTLVLRGRAERELLRAVEQESADLLVLARDGEHRLGPPSLGPRTRFALDHAGCAVLLVWAREPPGGDTMHWPRHLR